MTALRRELTAADLMTIEPVVVSYDALIEEAERLIRDDHVSGLPVVNQDGVLVGVISPTDFVHLADPDVRSRIRRASVGIRVGEVMSQPPVTVVLTTTLMDAARVMTRERVHRGDCCRREPAPLGLLAAMAS